MNRIHKKFNELKHKNKKALIVFITAGDPSLKKNEQTVLAFEKEGVDLIEIGVPFSDPLADGPVIQASSQRALKRGTHLKKILQLVRQIRRRSQIPLILMSYLNPLLHYGFARFASEARRAGVDGVIVPDLPPEEAQEIKRHLQGQSLDLIYLLAPTSTLQRIKKISRASSGFVYYVSLTGVTGARKQLSSQWKNKVRQIKKISTLPVCVGFGVSSPDQARAVASQADGVIIGSAVLRAMERLPNASAQSLARRVIGPYVNALRKKS